MDKIVHGLDKMNWIKKMRASDNPDYAGLVDAKRFVESWWDLVPGDKPDAGVLSRDGIMCAVARSMEGLVECMRGLPKYDLERVKCADSRLLGMMAMLDMRSNLYMEVDKFRTSMWTAYSTMNTVRQWADIDDTYHTD